MKHQPKPPLITRQFALGSVVAAVLGGLNWCAQGKYRDSESLWRATTKSSPDSLIAHVNLANADPSTIPTALVAFRKVSAARKLLPTEEIDFASLLVSTGDTAGVCERIDGALARGVSDHLYRRNALATRGAACLAARDWVQAERDFGVSLSFDPGFDRANYGMGVALAEQGRNAEAERSFIRALESNPMMTFAAHGLALVRARLEASR